MAQANYMSYLMKTANYGSQYDPVQNALIGYHGYGFDGYTTGPQ